jgi:hypothetical protein
MPLRYVVDDGCSVKKAAGGAVAFAKQLPAAADAENTPKPADDCVTCPLLGGSGCHGVIDPPVSATAEEWLVARLPAELESLPGLLVRKTLHDMRYEGEGGKALRKAGLLEASGPYTKHYGPFFRRYTVSSEQLLEQIFCVGDWSPVHSLGLLGQLGGIEVDGKALVSVDDAENYSALVQHPESRKKRTKCTIEVRDVDDRSVTEIKRMLIAGWAAFVRDCDLKIVEDA